MTSALRRFSTRFLLSQARGHKVHRRCVHLTAEENAEHLAIDDDEAPSRLMQSFELEKVDKNIYRSDRLVRGIVGRDAVYGGQVIGQALRAAKDTVIEEKRPHSMHCYFLKSGSVLSPIIYLVDRVREGKSFCTRIVKAVQDGENLFTAQISFQRPEEGGMQHARPMPTVPPPDKLLSSRELLRRAIDDSATFEKLTPHQQFFLQYKYECTPPTFHRVYEERPIDQNMFTLANVGGVKSSRMWVRAVLKHGDNDPLHTQLAAYISDSAIIENALFPHVAKGLVPAMVFSLDHAIWFHKRNFSLDDWCLWEVEADIAHGCRTFGQSRLWTSSGELVLTATQEGLVRPMKKGASSSVPYEG